MSIAREKSKCTACRAPRARCCFMNSCFPMNVGTRLARDLGVPPNRITGIINGKRAMTADTAALFEKRLGMPGEFWMNLQSNYDFAVARQRNAKAA